MSKQLKTVFEDGVFRSLEPVQIKEHQEVTLVLETTEEKKNDATEAKPIWEVVAELVSDIPEDTLNAVPKDGAAKDDHYLYGDIKRD